MADPINFDEWLAELERLGAGDRGDQDALTVQEWMERSGKREDAIRRYIRQGLSEGVMECVRKKVFRMDGVLVPVPAYRVVKKKAKGKK